MDYKIGVGGTVPLAMQTGSGVPSAPASVQQEGRRGLGGRQERLFAATHLIVNRANILPHAHKEVCSCCVCVPTRCLGSSAPSFYMRILLPLGGNIRLATAEPDYRVRRTQAWSSTSQSAVGSISGPTSCPPERGAPPTPPPPAPPLPWYSDRITAAPLKRSQDPLPACSFFILIKISIREPRPRDPTPVN